MQGSSVQEVYQDVSSFDRQIEFRRLDTGGGVLVAAKFKPGEDEVVDMESLAVLEM